MRDLDPLTSRRKQIGVRANRAGSGIAGRWPNPDKMLPTGIEEAAKLGVGPRVQAAEPGSQLPARLPPPLLFIGCGRWCFFLYIFFSFFPPDAPSAAVSARHQIN